jgi:hypothetical protein
MRAAVIGLSLTVAFLVGVITSNALGPAARADEGEAVVQAPRGPAWESMCLDMDKAGVKQNWANHDLYKKDGWNQALMRYGAAGWEPFYLVHDKGVVIAACFRRAI